MVDLHCHILPNVDDGSKSIEQSIKIAREAKECGFNTICCTPHYMIPNYISSKKENQIIISVLKEEFKKNNIDIELKLANEIYIAENVLELLNNDMVSKIEGTSYILIELPMHQRINFLDKILEEIQDNDIKIILAHPERYKYIQEDPNRAIEFIENGIILQSNYGSIIGEYGKAAQKTIKKLLKANMIDILASDVHRENSIYQKMDEIKVELKKIVSEQYFSNLTKINSQRIIEDKYLELKKYKRINKFF